MAIYFKPKTVQLIILLCIASSFTLAQEEGQLSDKKATRKAKALYSNLKKSSAVGIMFGHHEDTAYGINWKGEKGRSDVKEVCGQYPAVHGWDIGKIGKQKNINGVPFDHMKGWIKAAYRRGGVSTISWHMDNIVTGGDSWDTTAIVKDLLPGGKAHALYIEHLAKAADFLKQCRSGLFTRIPIIFRPFHEHNGDWFWWGKGFCTEEEFVQLFQFTVDYLRKQQKLHNLLIAFSPDRSRMSLDNAEEEYLYGYPGDAYVDIIGLDNYKDVGRSKDQSIAVQKNNFLASLTLITNIAEKKNKIAALTETGLERIVEKDWFSSRIFGSINAHPEPIQIAYFMVWRNANKTHHYAPYPGHSSEKDFLKFYEHDKSLFETDIHNIYSNRRFEIQP